jgi:UDP-glucose 4-epimerase
MMNEPTGSPSVSRVVVTGGRGFVGVHVVEQLRDRGMQVLVIDNLSTGHRDVEADPSVSFVQADFDSDEALGAIASFSPEAVVHLAALHYLPYCRTHPEETLRINATGTDRLLAGVDRLESLRRLVLASSAAVYGFSDEALTEDSALQPVDVYGESKILAERSVEEFVARRSETSAVMLRFFNVFGPRETTPHLIPGLVRQIARGEPVEVGNPWPRRDYVHVRDVAGAVGLSIDAAVDRPSTALNVATGRGTSVKEVIEILMELSGNTDAWNQDPDRVRDVDGDLVGDGSLARLMLGWEPAWTVERGLADLLKKELETA